MSLPVLVLAAVLALIALRSLPGLHLPIWGTLSLGALLVLATGSISPAAAWSAVDWEVIGFLFGVFVLGEALVRSGLLYRASSRLLGRVAGTDGLVLAVLLAGGLAAALLMNDTLAVIGTPLMLRLARAHRLPPALLLLALAFGITTGSVMSPIGNPQNLLIALHGGMDSPFRHFFGSLALPSLGCLLLAWAVLRLAFRRAFHGNALLHETPALADPALARLAAWSVGMMGVAILLKMGLAAWHPAWNPSLLLVALAACAPLLLASPRRLELALSADWRTLVFFVALFILVRAVWDSGELQRWLPEQPSLYRDIPTVLAGSVLGSQLLSNVPLVALALPPMLQAGADAAALMALAAGSTIAGNLTLVGAASNVIIVQSAERQGVHLGFWRFFAIGAPLTALQTAVYAWTL